MNWLNRILNLLKNKPLTNYQLAKRWLTNFEVIEKSHDRLFFFYNGYEFNCVINEYLVFGYHFTNFIGTIVAPIVITEHNFEEIFKQGLNFTLSEGPDIVDKKKKEVEQDRQEALVQGKRQKRLNKMGIILTRPIIRLNLTEISEELFEQVLKEYQRETK